MAILTAEKALEMCGQQFGDKMARALSRNCAVNMRCCHDRLIRCSVSTGSG
jgi:hypothetical protein